MYAILKFARFLIDFGMIYILESPLFKQGNKYYYPSDIPVGSIFPGGDFNPSKSFKRFKGLGALQLEEAREVFFDDQVRRLIRITTEGDEYSRKLVENINARKALLYENNILTNPYNFTDL